MASKGQLKTVVELCGSEDVTTVVLRTTSEEFNVLRRLQEGADKEASRYGVHIHLQRAGKEY